MHFLATANISHGALNILKNQSINENIYNELPEKYKIKFKAITDTEMSTPPGLNQVIGDTPEEKVRRGRLIKKDEQKLKSISQPEIKRKNRKNK